MRISDWSSDVCSSDLQIGRSSPEPSRRGFRISIPTILHRFAAVCMPARGYGLAIVRKWQHERATFHPNRIQHFFLHHLREGLSCRICNKLLNDLLAATRVSISATSSEEHTSNIKSHTRH